MYTPAIRKFYFRLMTCTMAAVLSTGLASAQKHGGGSAPARSAPAAAAHAAAPAKAGTAVGGKTAAGGVAGRSAGATPAARGSGITTSGVRGSGVTTSGVRTAGPTTGRPPMTRTMGDRGPGRRAVGPEHRADFRGPVGARDHFAHTAAGHEVRFRPNGRPGDFHAANRGMEIHHGLAGNHHVEVMRGDHTRFVNDRNRMFVQHPYRYGGREFGQRSYYVNGRVYPRYYAGYVYHGVNIDVYRPAVYYRPEFYGYAYQPFPAPVHYAFVTPWGGYYGAYFTPEPVYATPSLWLTDYMVSQSLANAYAASAGGNMPPMNAGTPMSPQVKQQIANEVQGQLALENDEITKGVSNGADPEAPGIQRSLADGQPHVFVAGTDLDVVDSGGNECAISEGDAVQLSGAPNAEDVAANVVVLASKGGQECHNGATVSVQVADLQEMQNHMREMVDAGLAEIQKKQGTGGLPTLPASANAPPVQAAYAAAAPPPDQNVATEVKQQVSEADRAEAQALAEAQPATGGPSAGQQLAQNDSPAAAPAPQVQTVVLTPGQTIEQVVAIEGQPKRIADLGVRKVYIFPDGIKVTFINGKSSAIE